MIENARSSNAEGLNRGSKIAAVLLVVAVGGISLFDVWLRSHAFGRTIPGRSTAANPSAIDRSVEPLDCDEALYAYMGKRMIHGAVLYRDLSENKPPLGYWLYEAAVAIGGYNETAIRVLPIPLVLLTIVFVALIASRIAGAAAAVVSAFLYALMSTDPVIFGDTANLEHASNLFAVASLAAFLAYLFHKKTRYLVACGAAVALATLVRQVGAIHGIVYFILLTFDYNNKLDNNYVRYQLRVQSRLAAGFALPIAIAVLVLTARGAANSAYDDIFRYGSALATDAPPDPGQPSAWIRWLTGNAAPDGSLAPPFGKTNYVVWWGKGLWPLWLVAPFALARIAFGPNDSSSVDLSNSIDSAANEFMRRRAIARRVVVWFTIASFVQVIAPGLYWQHYYLALVPGTAVAIGALADSAFREFVASFRERRFVAAAAHSAIAAAVCLTIILTCKIQYEIYLMDKPENLTIKHKGGRQWVELRGLARELAAAAKPLGERTLYVWGWQSPLLFYGDFRSPARDSFANALIKTGANRTAMNRLRPAARRLVDDRLRRIVADLDAHPPLLIFVAYPPFPDLKDRLERDYSAVETTLDGLGLWVRKDRSREFKKSLKSVRANHNSVRS
jgi:4-amino-4-deoxy-L-arabinose transferase-like glycosyltransferase